MAGKYGVPKHGNNDNFPLTPAERELLKRKFSVNIVYPELAFFGLASVYLLKGRLHRLMKGLDDYLFQFPSFRQYSYRQYLLLS